MQGFAKLQQYLQAGQGAQALPLARRLVTLAPNSPDAQQLLGLCCVQSDELDEAEVALERAVALAPGHPMVLANLATLLRRRGRLEAAAKCWRECLAADPGQAQAWCHLGLIALDLQRHEEARTALRRAVALSPLDAKAWHGLGHAAQLVDDLDEAEPALRRSLQLAPDNRTAWLSLGAVRRLQGRADDALQCYEQARKYGADSLPDLDDAVSGALVDLGRASEALECARVLTERFPQWAAGHVTRAQLQWEHGGNEDDPLAAFRTAAQNQPANRELQVAWARTLLQARRCDEALQTLDRLLPDAHPDELPLLHTMQANAQDALGRTDTASGSYARALSLWGDRVPASFLNAYARHLLRAGDIEQAERRAAAATRLMPSDQEAWAYLATAWRIQGDAREHWLCDLERFAVRLDVETPPGYSTMDRFLAALQDVLLPLHQARREPVEQSVRAGSQTPGRLFGRADPVLAAAQQALQRTAERWLATLPYEEGHPFLGQRHRTVRFTGSWSVRLWSSGHHANHIHPQGWTSSAFYVALPPSMASDGGEAGCLQLGQPPDELGLQLPPRKLIRPAAGTLALFPSYLWHGTVPFEDTLPRLSLAFDLMPRG